MGAEFEVHADRRARDLVGGAGGGQRDPLVLVEVVVAGGDLDQARAHRARTRGGAVVAAHAVGEFLHEQGSEVVHLQGATLFAGSVIVVGYAKVSVAAASHSTHEFFSISLRIDRETSEITEVDSTAVTGLVRHWLADLLTGADFAGDIDPVLAEIETAYLGHGAGAIRQAISDAWRRYATYRKS